MAAKANGVELGVGYVSVHMDSGPAAAALKKEMGDAGTEAGKKAGKNASSEFNDKLKSGIKKSSVAVGALAGAGIASGLKQAAGMQDLEGSIMAQLGTTPGAAGKIAAAAGAAYTAGWGQSLDEIGKSAAILEQTLNLTGGEGNLEELTVKSQALAETFEQDTAALANSAGQLIKTGLVENMDEAFDLLAVGFQSNAKLSEDFVDSIDEYSVQFQTLGLDGAESLGLMNQALAAGARNGDQAVDALKEFAIRGKDGSKAAAAGYDLLGLSATDMTAKLSEGGDGAKEVLQTVLDSLRELEDPVKQNTAGVGLFGTKWEDMQKALMAMDPKTAADGLGELGGAASELVENAAGFDQVISGLGRTLNEGLGTAVAPLLPDLVALSEKGLGFFKWIGDHPIITKTLLGIGAAIGIVAASTFVWNAAMLGNPMTWIVLLIVAGIIAAVSAITYMALHWEEFTENAAWAANALLSVMTTLWNGVLTGVNKAIDGVNLLAGGLEKILSLNGLLGDWGWGEMGTFSLLDLPGLATGGTVTGSGSVLVGEAGPEVLRLPTGASVIPLDHPAAGASGGGPTVIYNAAENRSLDSEADLHAALGKTSLIGA